MNLTQKNKIIQKQAEEDIEIVEGELIDLPEKTGIEKKRSTGIKARGTIEFATMIGSAALGLFKIFRMFYGNNSSEKTSARMHRRRRRK